MSCVYLVSRSASPESTAWNSYQALGGYGNLTGDGLVPVDWAHLPGAQQLTIKGCLHSINIAGTTLPTNRFSVPNERFSSFIPNIYHTYELQPKFRLMESRIRAVSIFWKLSWGLENDNTLFKKR